MSATHLPARSPWALLPRAAVVGVLLILVGAFGTWATADVAGTSASKAGMDGDGALTLVLALVAGGVLAFGALQPARRLRWALLVPAALVVVIAVADVLDVLGTGGGVVEVSVGWGLWATLAGGVLLLAEAVRRLRVTPR